MSYMCTATRLLRYTVSLEVTDTLPHTNVQSNFAAKQLQLLGAETFLGLLVACRGITPPLGRSC